MALSTQEHDLLVTTCDNMNIAASSCREVLEMLRSLGNTGVVDIADHNNASGRHASDTTLAHLGGDPATAQNLAFGPKVFNNSIMSLLSGTSVSSINRRSATEDSTTAKITLSDIAFLSNSGEKVTFAADSTANPSRTGYNITIDTHRLTDSTGAYVQTTITHKSNRRYHIASEAGNHAQSSIIFGVTSGTISACSDVIEIDSFGLIPCTTQALSLGHSNYKFNDIYLVNSPTTGSDARIKKDVVSLGDSALAFIKALRPVGYKLVEGERSLEQRDEKANIVAEEAVVRDGSRTHWGLVAQEVKQAMTAAGIEDAAVWCLADKDDPDSMQSLRYEELIAPLIKAVQVLAAKVEALEVR